MAMASTQAADYEELIKEDRVHGRLYYDPAIFHEEMEKIWHRQWVYQFYPGRAAEAYTKHLGWKDDPQAAPGEWQLQDGV